MKKVVIKNSDSHLGQACDWCGGYGYLNNITGGSSGCSKCEQTGVKLPSKAELLKRISALERLN